MATSNMVFGKSPREARNADKTGKYELIPQVSNTVLNRGEEIIIDIYITGYGQISDGKIYFSLPSNSTHGLIKSNLQHGLLPIMKENNMSSLAWGHVNNEFDSAFLLGLTGGIMTSDWKEVSLLFDAFPGQEPANNALITEQSLGDIPPFRIRISFSEKVKPGTYNVNCILTYYNGEAWQNSSFNLALTVRNLFQQYEGWVSVLGILAALGSSTGIIALGIQLWSLAK